MKASTYSLLSVSMSMCFGAYFAWFLGCFFNLHEQGPLFYGVLAIISFILSIVFDALSQTRSRT